ncbi:hypothetical protein AVEN_50356-1 [Araneus ventricosus]|uniref:Uncharacterized protein n=1 Tax=Araneus ventricosus TaxID=182803 RepID=A0A4Y2EAH3_ARAVE|nr:hypothetical protein AVEN_50356-1 [Araneus ventricosus]
MERVKSFKIVEPTSYQMERALGEKERSLSVFFLVSDKNTKEMRIVVWIMAKNKRYERVSGVAVAVMGRGKWSTKDYEILARWFKLRREKEKWCFTAGPKGQLINENQ